MPAAWKVARGITSTEPAGTTRTPTCGPAAARKSRPRICPRGTGSREAVSASSWSWMCKAVSEAMRVIAPVS